MYYNGTQVSIKVCCTILYSECLRSECKQNIDVRRWRVVFLFVYWPEKYFSRVKHDAFLHFNSNMLTRFCATLNARTKRFKGQIGTSLFNSGPPLLTIPQYSPLPVILPLPLSSYKRTFSPYKPGFKLGD
jgi:hypothetical protein